MLGNPIIDGAKVARAINNGGMAYIKVCTANIRYNKVYIDGSKQPLAYPERLLVLNPDVLYSMIKNYEGEN
jgi:hypothetical protein